MRIPAHLLQAITTGKCVLFIGAGIGYNCFRPNGEIMPAGEELRRRLIVDFNLSRDDFSLADAAQLVQNRGQKEKLNSWLERQLSNFRPDDNIVWLLSRRWTSIYTTNYDSTLLEAYSISANPQQEPVVMALPEDAQYIDPITQVPLIYLHGRIFGEGDHMPLITRDDYARFRSLRQQIYARFMLDLSTLPILYLGYSLRDPNWLEVYNELLSEFPAGRLPQSYRLDPNVDPEYEELHSANKVMTMHGSLEEFIEELKHAQELSPAPISTLKLSYISSPSLSPLAETGAGIALRVERDWQVVQDAEFGTADRKADFFRGDRPEWSLIANGIPFRRDLENEVYENHLLDFATDNVRKVRQVAILGSAGFGATTLLMTMAFRVLSDRVGLVLFHRGRSPVRASDLAAVAAAYKQTKLFVFIDDAARWVQNLKELIRECRRNNLDVIFVYASRLNEWREAHLSIGHEFLLGSLSNGEIERLLECLERNGELGKLGDVEPGLRVAAIRKLHGKQLLVTLRQATEGKTFDAIIEDEYDKIKDSAIKRAYLVTAGMHQFGIRPRAELVSDVLNLDLLELLKSVAQNAPGVFSLEMVNPDLGTHVIGARHRVIAEVLWERCFRANEMKELPIRMLKAINITIPEDKALFDNLVSSVEFVDAIASFEGKVEFFELAIRKAPANPYVHQHFARMYERTGHLESARTEIDAAIAMDQSSRVLFHTRGRILQAMALADGVTDSVAKRYLVLSEGAFKTCISMAPRDEHGYHGLANLYFQWAASRESHEEMVLYLEKSEIEIGIGLRQARSRQHLTSLSAAIKDFVGRRPDAKKILENYLPKAEGPMIPYVLASMYFKEKNYEQVVQTLSAQVETFEDVRTVILYALAKSELERNYQSAIALLDLMRNRGLRDPRYVATLYGVLHLTGECERCRALLGEAAGQPWWTEVRVKGYFEPTNFAAGKDRKRFKGTIRKIDRAYAYIKLRAGCVIRTNASALPSSSLRIGQVVAFKLSYSARGARVSNLAAAPLAPEAYPRV